jgi:hypothetical protein
MVCTAKNRIPQGRLAHAKCGQCGKLIYPDIAAKNRSGTAASSRAKSTSRAASNTYRQQPRKSKFKRYLFFGVVGVIALFTYLSNDDPGSSKTAKSDRNWWEDGSEAVDEIDNSAADDGDNWGLQDPVVTGEPESPVFLPDEEIFGPANENANLPPPVPIKSGLVWNKTGRKTEAPFQIVTRGDHNYFVKLVDSFTGLDAVAVYVPGGRTLDVEVPLGTYEMRYAAGNSWRGEKHYFGAGNLTSYSKTDETFYFKIDGNQISGYTIELFIQSDGNLHTENIDASQF